MNFFGTTDKEQQRDGAWPYYLAGGELAFFILSWRHFYWEILRVGAGVPYLGYWGTALGYPFRLDSTGRHQLRLGAHLTFRTFYWPDISGVMLYYQYRPIYHFSFHAGLMEFSYPTGLLAIVGFAI